MSVQELTLLHQRYIDLSDRFRAAWTFQQFLQGLQKIFLEGRGEREAIDFQSVYAVLKEISQGLNTSEVARVRVQLDGVEKQLHAVTDSLLREDSQVSPSLLRQFFQRVKNYDERILTQLVKFYLYAQESWPWDIDRADKADFLVTKLCEERPGSGVLREQKRLREILSGLWSLASGHVNADARQTDASQRELADLQRRLAAISDFDELVNGELLRRYRTLKHGLGALLFEPDIAQSIVETNLAVRRKLREVYAQEEQRIFAESQRIFELERQGQVDDDLDSELASFRRGIENFERQVQQDNLRLVDLASIRQQVDSLLPRLAGSRPAAPERPPNGEVQLPPSAAEVPRLPGEDLLREHYQRLMDTLSGTAREGDAKAVTVTREVFPFRLEPREVIAYRRLAVAEAGADRELETFLLEAAALRVRINEEAEEIAGLLDETAVTRTAPVFERARATGRLADSFVRRFSHAIDQAVLEGNFAEAQILQLLRMRMIRDYSGLWLLTNRR
jgi:hypothetical protein